MNGTHTDILADVVNTLVFKTPSGMLDVWHPVGYDGIGSQYIGKGDSAFAFRFVGFGTMVSIQAWRDYILSLQSRTIAIVDEFGDRHNNLLVQAVTLASPCIRKIASLVPYNPYLAPVTDVTSPRPETPPDPPIYNYRGEVTVEGRILGIV